MDKLRECEIDGRKGRFHVWENYSDVIPPSNLVGGHNGGTVSQVFAIVEFENGSVERCEPYKVVFKTEQNAEVKNEHKGVSFKETRTKCPFCEEENAVVYADKENKEYFVYCLKCKIETIETYKSAQSAIKEFSEGKNKGITGEMENET